MSSLYERRFRKSRLLSRSSIVFALRCFWVAVVVWCEFGVFFQSLSGCTWPDDILLSDARSPSQATPTHVLLLADARLRNPALSSLKSWLLYDSNLSYLRKSWKVASRLHPDAVIFLGDTFASGRYVTSKVEYDQYHRAFDTTFPRDASVPLYLIPGNNDIGLGDSSTFSEDARRFFEERFGPSNRVVSIAGHQFILLNAPGLVEEDYRRHAHGQSYDRWTPLPGGPIEFVRSISDQVDVHAAEPKILLSHIPLFRPSSKSCGPLRERGSIRTGAGLGYQTMLGKQTTDFLLRVLRPSVVFSGDNRDYCEIIHELPQADAVREVTVKSFSQSRHIRRPGFQLLSLVPPSSSSDGPSFVDVSCLLPDTQRVFRFIYVPCLALTALALLYLNIIKPSRHRRHFSTISPISLARYGRSSSPEPESAIWATRTPKSRMQTSPPPSLPFSSRIPSTKSVPSYRASPVTTPHDSPLLSPIALFPSGDERDMEEEEYMGPSHYSLRRDIIHGNGWQGEHEDDVARECDVAMTMMGSDPTPGSPSHSHSPGKRKASGAYFLPPPLSQHARSRWSVSWSFVFRGRRRRMTIGVPDWRAWWSWLLLSGGPSAASTGGRRTASGKGPGRGRGTGHLGRGRERRGLAWRFASDCVSVALPAVVVWTVIGWIFF